MKRVVAVLILLSLSLSLMLTAGEKFRYKFEKGKTYRYQVTTDSRTSGSMGGMEFTADSKLSFVTAMVSQGMTSEGLELIATLERATAMINVPMMGLRDSTMELSDYVGKRVRLVVSDRGKLVSFTIIDTVVAGRMSMMLGGAPTELLKRLLVTLPEGPMEAKGAWKENTPDTTKNGGVTMVIRPNIDFQAVGKETKGAHEAWKIMVNGVSAMEGAGTARGMDVTVDGSTKIAGTLHFAPKAGLLVEYDATTDSEVTQTFSGAQSGAQLMTTTSKNVIKLLN